MSGRGDTRRWAVLLRGVNVGRITIRTAPLSACLQTAGYTGVRSVLASGNVSLQAPADHDLAQVKSGVEAALRAEFGYDAWVVVLTPERLAEVAAGYPFERADDEFQPYCVFTSDASRLAELADRASANPSDEDRLQLAGDVLYWRVAKGNTLHSPFGKLSAAKVWKPVITARNLRTVDKLVAVGGDAS